MNKFRQSVIAQSILGTWSAGFIGIEKTRRFAGAVQSKIWKGAMSIVVPVAIIGVLSTPVLGTAAVQAPAESIVVITDTESAEVVPKIEEQVKPTKVFRAVITQYSRADSCHNKKNGKCLMASGREVYVGAVACPYSLRLGDKVSVDGVTYTCEDRYAKWVDAKRGLPTIDIFVESNPTGRYTAEVAVLPAT